MALCGPQTSYADYFKDKLVHNANISYCCPLQACEFEVCTKLPPTDLWLESQQTLIPSKDPRSLHADDCSIARISLTSLWCDSAGTFLKVPTANESSFRQSIYSGGPVSQEQQSTQYADYGKLTQVMDSNKSSQARSRSQPFRSSFNLPIAAGASRQHRQITGYPMNASVADSQSWRSNLKVSGIVVSSSGPQSSSASLRDDFTRQTALSKVSLPASMQTAPGPCRLVLARGMGCFQLWIHPKCQNFWQCTIPTTAASAHTQCWHQTTQSNPSLELL